MAVQNDPQPRQILSLVITNRMKRMVEVFKQIFERDLLIVPQER